MASEGGGKIKSKRGHSSSKPYERGKSFFGRIADSLKEVLRPSWLAADSGQISSVGDRPAVSSVSEEEEEFFSPAQSPSQLPGQSGLELRRGKVSASVAVQYRDAKHNTGDGSFPLLQSSRGSSTTWENRSQATKSTWSNNIFDKAQITRYLFPQSSTGDKPAVNAIETSARGLGGVAPARTTTGHSVSVHERFGRSKVDADSSATASHRQSEQNREMTDSALASTSTASSTSESAAEENPSKRQRLWSPEDMHRRQSHAAHRPAFKASVFSFPRLNESKYESSFYSGSTTYGGASAYRRTSLNSSLPYQNALPIRKSVKAKPLDNSGNAVLSSSATQILKTLERLSDTRRSRINDTDTETFMSFTPTSYRKPSRPLQTSSPSRLLEVSARGPPTQFRQTPVAASIAKNRQIVSLLSQRPHPVPSSSFTQRTEEEEEDDDDHESEVMDLGKQRNTSMPRSEFTESAASRSSGKMKHQKSYDTRGRTRKPSREEDDEIPNLRTDFTLPISSMPAFNLGFPAFSNSQPIPDSTVSKTKVESDTPLSQVTSPRASTKPNTSPPKLQFTFSSPIHKSAPGPTQPSHSPVGDFQFSSPLKVSDSVSTDGQSSFMASGSNFTTSAQGTTPAWGSTEAKPKSGNSKSCPAGSLGKLTSPVNFGLSTANSSVTSTFGGPLAPASELKSGSVMDILGKSSTAAIQSTFKASSELKQGSVTDVLGGRNDGKVGSSLSALKPAPELKRGSVMDILGKQSSSTSPQGKDSLFAKFAPPADSWECPACMVRNTPDANKCVACTTAKPAQQSKASPASLQGRDSLFAKFAPPADSWECPACMVRNTPDANKCVACTTARPAQQSKASSTSSQGRDSLFAKLAPPADSWECSVCMVRNTPDANKCVACTTARPAQQSKETGLSKPAGSSNSLFAQFAPPAGSWECNTCMVQNKAEADKCVACETCRPGPAHSAPTPSTSGGDSLFAKFTAPPGSWECEDCMLRNKPEATVCVACERPKPGAAASTTSGSSDPLMAKFKRPAGTWDCDVCLVQNAGGHAKCVACESPRPGAMSTGTVPPPAPKIQVTPGGGFTFTPPSGSSAPSPFGAAFSTSAQSSASGFKFVPPSSTSSSSSTSEGFQLGSSESKPSLFTGGFKFDQQDTSNSASSRPSSGFSFGIKDSSSACATTSEKTVSSMSSGFQFGVPLASSAADTRVGFVFGAPVSSGSTTATSTTTTTPVTVSGFAMVSTTGVGGFQFGTVAQTSSQSIVDTKSAADKLTTSESVRTRSLTTAPVFALTASLTSVTGSENPLIAGGFKFQGPSSSSKDMAPSPFATGLLSSPALSADDTSKIDGVSAAGKPSSAPGGFTYPVPAKSSSDATSKSGLFASTSTDSSKKNGVSSSVPSSSISQGFVFGTASSGSSLSRNVFSSVPQLSRDSFTASAAKLPVNGEVGATAPFSFGQQSVSKSSTTGSFSFPAPAGVKDSSSTNNPLTQSKTFTFGTDAAAVGKSAPEKRHLDNDVGPTDAKKRADHSVPSSIGGSEGFKFGSSATGVGSNVFKFSQTPQGSEEKSGTQSGFGGQASGFGASTQSGFTFPLQSNAASSTGGQQAASVFGAGAGTGHFSFGLAAGAQSNAAAASPFGSDAPAPTQGYNFSGATQPSFNFGANSTNSAAPVFQFGSSQSGDPPQAQPAAGGVFMFGQTAPSADSSAPPSAFTASTPAASFGAAPAQNNFNIGTGDGPRKIKRAVRRTVRK